MDKCDVAILGSGPYGLSAAAHLVQVKGLDVRMFGETMSFWERHMPERMLLRSPWDGSHIGDPGHRLSLNVYRKLEGNHHLREPLPLKHFIRYGRWFQRQVGLACDRRSVDRVASAPGGYQLTLEDGETLWAQRVVVAAGIQPFAYRPRMFKSFPRQVVSHTSERTDFKQFAGKVALVVGGGQSALETAALLHEAGALVEVLVRKPTIHWLRRYPWVHSPWISWMLYGSGDVGSAGVSLLVQRPNLFRLLPRALQTRWAADAMQPAGARWLESRTRAVRICTGRFLCKARLEGERIRVRRDDGAERVVDHLFLGTGYRVNVALYPFLPPELVQQIDMVEGYPRLNAGFECSLPGLHFLGAPAAWSFGPLTRFVAGTPFTAQALRRGLLQARKPLPAPQRITVTAIERPLPFEVKAQKSE